MWVLLFSVACGSLSCRRGPELNFLPNSIPQHPSLWFLRLVYSWQWTGLVRNAVGLESQKEACYYLPTPDPAPSVVLLSYTFGNMLLRVVHPLSRSVRYLTKLHYHASSRSTKRGSHFPILTNSSHPASSEGPKQRYKLNVWAHVNIWCTCAHKYLPWIGMRAEVGEPS